MPQTSIKAVMFDLGDTLLDFGKVNTTRLFYHGAQLSYAFLKSQKQPVPRVFFWYFIRNLASLRWHHVLSNWTRRDFDSLDVLRALGERRGIRLPDSDWEEMVWLWYEGLGYAADVEPDLAGTMTRLKAQGLKLALLSNTFVHSSTLDRHLGELGLLDFLQERLYSYQFPFRKPDQRIFQAGAERLQEAPEHILYVGDRIDNDIRPTLALGMHAALKRCYSNVGKRVPDGAWAIDRIADLPALVERHNAGV